jgi:chemotaxis protein methyltransferase CheR
MNITPMDFEQIAEILYRTSGLKLNAEKLYLLESRLTPLARRRNHADLRGLVEEILQRPSDALISELTESMMTHESFFFRDTKAFEKIKTKILPELRAHRAGGRKLRIWCAAASTGQEPYSIAMLFADQPELWRDWTIEILGTDIANSALEKAVAGRYSQFEVQRGLPIQMLIKHFTQKDEAWQVNAPLKSMVKWRQYNLLESAASFGTFDLILCRNVCIYFDAPAKKKVLMELNRRLASDGHLILGGSETILGNGEILSSSDIFPGFFVPVQDSNARRMTA